MTNGISLDIFGYTRGGNVAAPKNEDKTMEKEYLVRFEPADDRYCTKMTIFVFAASRLDAINKTLDTVSVKKFIKVVQNEI